MDTSSRNRQTYRIAGLTYHIELSEAECGEFDGFIEPEPTNRHDPDAMVIKKSDGRKMGYIQRDMTELFRSLHGRRRVACSIRIEGIKDNGDLVFIKGYATVSSERGTSRTEREATGQPRDTTPPIRPSRQTPPTASDKPQRPTGRSAQNSQTEARREPQPVNGPARCEKRQATPVKRPRRQSAEKHADNTIIDNTHYNIGEGKNVSPLTSFEMFFCFMMLVALLLLLAHIFSS